MVEGSVTAARHWVVELRHRLISHPRFLRSRRVEDPALAAPWLEVGTWPATWATTPIPEAAHRFASAEDAVAAALAWGELAEQRPSSATRGWVPSVQEVQ